MTAWARWGRTTTAATVAALIGATAFVWEREVPLLDGFDLAVHETGHILTAFMPDMVMFMAGSVAQVAVPLALALYFLADGRDRAAAVFCLAWAGTSARDVSVYASDAVAQALPLIGGGQHDWAYILGPRGFDALDRTSEVAGFIAAIGALMVLGGLGLAATTVVRELRADRRMTEEPETALPEQPRPVSAPGVDPWAEAAQLPFHHEAP